MIAGTKSYLDTPLIKFSQDPTDWWTIRNAVEGSQIFGGIGSGKTSGSGRMMALSFLRNGFGGIVLCAKPDEANEWEKYARLTGREKDLIIFNEGSSKGGGLTMNITELFMTVFKMGQRITGSSTEEKERFWDNSLKRCINRIVDLIKLAGEELNIDNMIELISQAPHDLDMFSRIANEFDDEQIKEIGKTNYCIKCLYNAGENANTPQKEREYDIAFKFFLRDFPMLDTKVRTTIMEMLLGFCEPFLSGILYNYFTRDTNLVPEMTFQGKIIVLDFSVKDYLVAGIYAQCIFKFLWQQAVERRPIEKDTKPVFYWADESQYFVNEYDTIFQTTARSARACTVFLTQNISNYYAQMGGDSSKAKVESLLGNLSTKIFHCNNDPETNEWASKVLGQTIIALESGGLTRETFSLTHAVQEGFNMQLLPQILPYEFSILATGGELNNFETQAIVTTKGKTWSDSKNYRKVIFSQNK
jgi:TraM recognition site of TraD and TraG